MSHLISNSSLVPTSVLFQHCGKKSKWHKPHQKTDVWMCWCVCLGYTVFNVYYWTQRRRGCLVTCSSQRDTHTLTGIYYGMQSDWQLNNRRAREQHSNQCVTSTFPKGYDSFCKWACWWLCANIHTHTKTQKYSRGLTNSELWLDQTADHALRS